MRAEALKGHLDGLLLAVLEPGPLHGYAVIERLRAGSGGRIDLPTGTVYPALHRLERAGLVRSRWSSESGRRRRRQAVLHQPVRARRFHRVVELSMSELLLDFVGYPSDQGLL
jgi:Fe2+ or Zn2+ uptake regulation protein